MQDLENQIKLLTEERDALNAKVNENDDFIDTIVDEMEQYKSDSEAKLTNITAENVQLKLKLDASEEAYKDARNDATDLLDQLNEKDQLLDQISEEIAHYKEDKAKEIEELRSKLNSLLVEHVTVKSTADHVEYASELEKLERIISQKDADIDTLHNKLDDVTGLYQQSAEENRQDKETLEDCLEKIVQFEGEVNALRERNEELQGDISTIKTHLDDERSENDSITTELSSIKETVAKLNAENEQLKFQLSQGNSEGCKPTEIHLENESLSMMANNEEEIRLLKSELRMKEQQIADLQHLQKNAIEAKRLNEEVPKKLLSESQHQNKLLLEQISRLQDENEHLKTQIETLRLYANFTDAQLNQVLFNVFKSCSDIDSSNQEKNIQRFKQRLAVAELRMVAVKEEMRKLESASDLKDIELRRLKLHGDQVSAQIAQLEKKVFAERELKLAAEEKVIFLTQQIESSHKRDMAAIEILKVQLAAALEHENDVLSEREQLRNENSNVRKHLQSLEYSYQQLIEHVKTKIHDHPMSIHAPNTEISKKGKNRRRTKILPAAPNVNADPVGYILHLRQTFHRDNFNDLD